MKMPSLKAKSKPKRHKGNIHFGKVFLTLMLVFTMILGNINFVEARSVEAQITFSPPWYVDVLMNTAEVREYSNRVYAQVSLHNHYQEENDGIYYRYTDEVIKMPGATYRAEIEEVKKPEYGVSGIYILRLIALYLPQPPSHIIVPTEVKGGESIIITWGSSSNATRYYLERSVNGGSWTQIYSGNDLSYIDSITKGWNTVRYRVRAYNYDGYSDYTTSPTRNVINNSSPILTITAPTENSYFGKEKPINISGTVRDQDSGDTLTIKYTISGITAHTNQTLRTITANGSDQRFNNNISIDSSIPEGNYTLKVWVEDNKGGKSTEVVRNINIDKTAPNEFTPTVIANSISEITVSGETTDSGSKLKPEPYSYKLNNDDWSEWTSEKSKKYTDLNTNTRYDFTMRAIDNVGNVRVTKTIQKYTLAEAPGLTIIDASDTSIIGEINPKSNPNDTEYKIEYSLDGNTWTKIDGRNEWDTSLDFAATNLLPGKKYYVRVKARNGDKLETGYSNIENIITKPQAPVLKEPVAISGSEIELEWDKVLSALKYHVEYKESNSSSWTKLTTTENLIKIGQLNPNEQYDFRVRSENETGLSDYSSIKNRYTKALNPKKIILKEVTGTSLTFEVVNDSRNINTPETILRLDGVGDTGWSTDKTKSFSGLEPGRTYKLSINTRNGDKEDNGWLNVPEYIPIEDEFGNPVTEITTIIPVENFKVVDSSVNTLTVSWNAELNQEYEVYLKDESGNEVPNTRSGWFSGGTYTFTNLPSPNTRYVPYIITRRVRSATHLAERKVLNDEKAYTNAEGISRGVFESGDDYITIKLNVENTRNPNDTEYVIKNDITGQEVTVTHDNPVWLNTNLAKESFYTYSVRVINKNKEPSYYTRLVFEDGDEAHTTLPDIDIEPGKIVDDGEFINLDDLKGHDTDHPIWFNPEIDLNNNIVQLEGDKYKVTRNRIEEIKNREEIEVINYSYSREGFGYTDWKPLEEGFFTEKLVFNMPGIYLTHWKFKNYRIESDPVLINYYVDWIAPTIEGESAIKGQTVVTGNEFRVVINAKDNISPYLFYSTDDGLTWFLLKEGQNEIVFSNINKSSNGIQNKLTVKVADIAGNVIEKTFTVWGIEK